MASRRALTLKAGLASATSPMHIAEADTVTNLNGGHPRVYVFDHTDPFVTQPHVEVSVVPHPYRRRQNASMRTTRLAGLYLTSLSSALTMRPEALPLKTSYSTVLVVPFVAMSRAEGVWALISGLGRYASAKGRCLRTFAKGCYFLKGRQETVGFGSLRFLRYLRDHPGHYIPYTD